MVLTDEVRRVVRTGVYGGQRQLLRVSNPALRTALEITDDYSMLSQMKRVLLFREGRKIMRAGVVGAFAELGVHRGGGLGMLGGLFAKAPSRQIHLFDRWGDFPVATEADGAWQKQFTETNIQNLVREAQADTAAQAVLDLYLAKWRVHPEQLTLHRGWFSETLPVYQGDPIVFAHVDADFYESSAEAFAFLEEHLTPTATVVLDDWSAWPGVEKAFNEWRASSRRNLDLSTQSLGHQAVVRVSPKA